MRIHTFYDEKNYCWYNKKDYSQREIQAFLNQKEAIKFAKRIAKRECLTHIIYNLDGTVDEQIDYYEETYAA